MRVISRRKLREYWEKPGRRDSEQSLKTWYSVAVKATWTTPDDLKADFGASVDLAHGKYVFDIKGNHHRLISVIDFTRHGLLILWVGTHAEYDELNKRNGEKLKQL